MLVIGASTEESLGYQVGESVRQLLGCRVEYASRSGFLGRQCDVRDATMVRNIVNDVRPHVIVQAAGVYSDGQELHELGATTLLPSMYAHILAKSIGTLLLLGAAVATGGVRHFVAFGGREVSSAPSYGVYTAANGAMWSVVEFANRHTNIRSHLIDLPLVEGSAMGKRFLEDTKVNADVSGAIPMQTVTETVLSILRDEVEPGRIILGEGWTV